MSEALLDDLPDKPPSFARPMSKSPYGEAVVWTDHGPTSITSKRCIGIQEFTTLKRGAIKIRINGWLPVTQCRIGGEKPEAVPQMDRIFIVYDTVGGMQGPTEWPSKFEDETNQGPLGDHIACWDYADIESIDTKGDNNE